MNKPASSLRPIVIAPEELDRWSDSRTRLVRLCAAWARYAPRGKAWLPNRIGRLLSPDARMTMRLPSGVIYAVAPHHLDTYAGILECPWKVDYHIRKSCLRVLQPGDVFYDIGANIGYMTLEIAAELRGQIKVRAFEPNPSIARALAVSVALNDLRDIDVFETMVGRTNQNATLYVTSHSIHASAIARSRRAEAVPCSMIALDDLAADGGIEPPNVIKIDVEGGELDAFNGARALISKHTPFLVFESAANAHRFGYTRDDLLELLSGFAPYTYCMVDRHRILEPGERLDDLSIHDIMAVPPGVDPKSVVGPL